MEQKRLTSNHLIATIPKQFYRAVFNDIDWEQRLIGILGPRGTGKTTLLLQALSQRYGFDTKGIYINLNDLLFSGGNLKAFVDEFCSMGGEHIYIDNVHKYPGWSGELRIIHDSHPNLSIVFSGSSAIDMLKHYSQVGQKASVYHLGSLSFPEFLALHNQVSLPTLSFSEILNYQPQNEMELPENMGILSLFDRYLNLGAYPIPSNKFEVGRQLVEKYLLETVEQDMLNMEGYDWRNAYKLKHLMRLIVQQAPFKPNLVALSDATDLHRNTLIGYLFHMERAKLIHLIYPAGENISIQQKPERVVVGNPNLCMLSSVNKPSREAVLQTFIINQLKGKHDVRLAANNLLEVDGDVLLGIETQKRLPKRIRENERVITLVDGVEMGSDRRVPIWLMGLLG